jgi:2-iminobutanoate/2-iminopropanoate deaminase
MTVEPIPTPSATPLGPYSPAIRAGDWVVCSGQIGVDPATGQLIEQAEAQAGQAFANVAAVLADCRCGWEHVARVTLFVGGNSRGSMPMINERYMEAVGEHRPARSTVGVEWLPLGALLEIEVWAYAPEGT